MDVHHIQLEEERPKVAVLPAIVIIFLCMTLDSICYIQPSGTSQLHIFLVILYIIMLYILIVFTAFYCLKKNVNFKGNMRLIQFYFILIELKIAVQYFEAHGESQFYGEFRAMLPLLSFVNFMVAVNYNSSQILYWTSHSLKLLISAAVVGIRYNTDLKQLIFGSMIVLLKIIVLFSSIPEENEKIVQKEVIKYVSKEKNSTSQYQFDPFNTLS